MKIKYMIFSLTAIICACIVSGYSALIALQNHHNDSTVQIKSATRYIGLSFDWYGITLPDNVIKYLHDMKSAEEAIDSLQKSQSENTILLQKYYEDTLVEEKDEAEFIRSNNELVDKMLIDVYAALAKGDKKAIYELLPKLYNITGQLCDKINAVIEIKTMSVTAIDEEFNAVIDNLKNFLYVSVALCLSLCVGMAIPDIKNEKPTCCRDDKK